MWKRETRQEAAQALPPNQRMQLSRARSICGSRRALYWVRGRAAAAASALAADAPFVRQSRSTITADVGTFMPGRRALVFVVALASCSHQSANELPMPSPGATCYVATYDRDSLAGMFPVVFVLDHGQDSAAAYWPPTRTDSVGIWRMFYLGSWRRLPLSDSLHVDFSNGFTSVELRLSGKRDSVLRGQATWLSDVIDTFPTPRSKLRAIPGGCRDHI